jgi:LmbE family N-acetylglucosaminyl deacetylase
LSQTILVCAAHPDDEALGCGGVMARHAAEGDHVHVLFLAEGVSSRRTDDGKAQAELSERRDSAIRAAKVLGAQTPIFCDYPDQRLDMISLLDVIKSIESLTADICPNVVYTHHAEDLNLDHRRVTQAVMTAFRPYPASRVVAIYGFETLSSTEWAFGSRQSAFSPLRYVSIATTLELKLAALREYRFEMRDFPHPRSYETVKALATLRGSTVGVPAAEAFTVLREVIR